MRHISVFCAIVFLFLVISSSIYAHGESYFLFDPDNAEREVLSQIGGEAHQVFKPHNDFLHGFDIWYDNPGTGGSIYFSLRDASETVLVSGSVFAPAKALKWGGNKLHMDFSSLIAVDHNSFYTLRIVTSLPEFALYKSDRTQLLQHSEVGLPQALIGFAKIGGALKEYSYKYGLSESEEASSPVSGDVAGISVSDSIAEISWHANEPVDYEVRFGPLGQNATKTIQFTGAYNFCVPDIPTCSISLGVVPGTAYAYELVLKDFWGNQSLTSGVFETSGSLPPPPPPPPPPTPTPPPPPSEPSPPPPPPPPPPTPSVDDTVPPVISNQRIVEISDTAVTFAWTTSEAANSLALVKKGVEVVSSGGDASFELEHLITVAGLKPQTDYFATIISRDPSANTDSETLTFGTLPEGAATSTPTWQLYGAAAGKNIFFVEQGSGVGDVSVVWTLGSQVATRLRVDLFNRENILVGQKDVSSADGRASFSGLSPGDYSAVVYEENNGVFGKISESVPVFVPSFWERLLAQRLLLGIILVALGTLPVILLIIQRKRNKAEYFRVPPIMNR